MLNSILHRNSRLNEFRKNTLFILDWDDTLFPTSFVVKQGISVINLTKYNKFYDMFSELDNALSTFLSILQKYGRIIIVTNAHLNWVAMSSTLLPKSKNIMKNFLIVSARNDHKDESNSMMDWKKKSFQTIIQEYYTNHKFVNIISIGDAEYEYHALINLYYINKFSRNKKLFLLKSVKFVKNPNPENIIEQLNIVSKHIKKILYSRKHLDLIFRDNKNIN